MIEVRRTDRIPDEGVSKPIAAITFATWEVFIDGEHSLTFGLARKTGLGHVYLWIAELRPTRRMLLACRDIVGEGVRRYGKLVAFAAPGRDTRFAEWAGFRQTGEIDGFVRLETWQQ